jgi:predicted lipoprotein with Yx(FWY)xxD motif
MSTRSPAPLLALALLLAACQGAGSGSTTPEPSDEAPASEAPMDSSPASEAPAPSEAASEAPSAEGAVLVTESAIGPILTDADGNTLYLFTNDSPGVSACSGGCATTWPPLTVAAEADAVAGEGVEAELGTIEREDGTLQVTIADVPLYLYAADTEPGDLAGHQVGGVWFAVTPEGEAAGEGPSSEYEY